MLGKEGLIQFGDIDLFFSIKSGYQLSALLKKGMDNQLRAINQMGGHLQGVIECGRPPAIDTPVFAVHCSWGHLHAPVC